MKKTEINEEEEETEEEEGGGGRRRSGVLKVRLSSVQVYTSMDRNKETESEPRIYAYSRAASAALCHVVCVGFTAFIAVQSRPGSSESFCGSQSPCRFGEACNVCLLCFRFVFVASLSDDTVGKLKLTKCYTRHFRSHRVIIKAESQFMFRVSTETFFFFK